MIRGRSRSMIIATALVAGVVALSLTLVFDDSVGTSEEHVAFRQALHDISALEGRLEAEVLWVRFDHRSSFDRLNRLRAELDAQAQKIRRVPTFVDARGRADIARETKRFADTVALKTAQLENYKTKLARLRNSLHYIPVLASELLGALKSAPVARQGVSRALEAILAASVEPSPQTLEQLGGHLALLEEAAPGTKRKTAAGLRAFVAHGRVIQDALTDVRRDIGAITGHTVEGHYKALEGIYLASFDRASARHHWTRVLLGLGCTLLVVIILLVMLKLRRLAGALAGANDDLEARVQARTDELMELHRTMLEVSRKAGMAEIAAGVIHNMGNALNQAFVSAGVIRGHVGSHRLADLERAVGLLTSSTSPRQFVIQDPRGDKVLSFFCGVTQALTRERELALEECDRVSNSLEHLRSVIAAQQSYSHYRPHIQDCVVADVVAEALAMESAASGNSQYVTFAVDDSTRGVQVHTDRHRLMDILVNYLKNAREAVLTRPDGDRGHVTIRTTLRDDTVRIEVKDDGVGMDAATLRGVFGHGFTTKADGHGFGLHACANAAKELGGQVGCHSDGLGTGSTFYVDMPRAA